MAGCDICPFCATVGDVTAETGKHSTLLTCTALGSANSQAQPLALVATHEPAHNEELSSLLEAASKQALAQEQGCLNHAV